jgi:hypothetical protein
MRFEAREVRPHSMPVAASELQEGSVYFFLDYEDPELLVPKLQPVVFIGRDLRAGDVECAYFQDVASHRRGCRFPAEDGSGATYFCGSLNELGHAFNFEQALDSLLACSLRREGRHA